MPGCRHGGRRRSCRHRAPSGSKIAPRWCPRGAPRAPHTHISHQIRRRHNFKTCRTGTTTPTLTKTCEASNPPLYSSFPSPSSPLPFSYLFAPLLLPPFTTDTHPLLSLYTFLPSFHPSFLPSFLPFPSLPTPFLFLSSATLPFPLNLALSFPSRPNTTLTRRHQYLIGGENN